jgi:hypothetical protein
MRDLEGLLGDTPGHNAAVKVFLCHSSKDNTAVQALAGELKEEGYAVWWFENELDYGDPIRTEVEKHIRESDVFVLCYSQNSVRSRWVREELDLALSLEGSEACQIQIYKLDNTPLFTNLRRRNWQTGREKFRFFHDGLFFDSTRRRCFDPLAAFDSKSNWLRSFAPRWDYYGYGGKDGDAIPDALFDMLDDLFDDVQLSHREDWRGWISDAANNLDINYRDLIISISLGQRPIAFISLTPYVSTGFVFGNYFGVLRKHRSNNYARILYDGASLLLNELYDFTYREGLSRPATGSAFSMVAKPHGYLFEVESLPLSEIGRILDRFASLQLPREPQEMTARQTKALRTAFTPDQVSLMRAAKRVALYERNRCLAFVDIEGTPLPYVGPANKQPLTSEAEVDYVLMYCPINTSGRELQNLFSYREVLRAFYFDWYGDGNAKANAQAIPGYGPYLQDLYHRVATTAPERFQLGSLQNGSIKRLLDLDRRYKVSGAI